MQRLRKTLLAMILRCPERLVYSQIVIYVTELGQCQLLTAQYSSGGELAYDEIRRLVCLVPKIRNQDLGEHLLWRPLPGRIASREDRRYERQAFCHVDRLREIWKSIDLVKSKKNIYN